jgi:hypothetical protein
MLSHVEQMAPAPGAFKLFGKVITQCAAPAQDPRAAAFVRERAEPGESDLPTVKREACGAAPDHDFEKQQQHGGAEESKGAAGHPRSRQQQQDTAEASSAPPLPCPRCRSRNTKFCYFNNYNVNQPRHFCRDCHRYWTAGGALRNVPVGAGRRKNRPLGPVVPGHAHHRGAAGFILGFPGNPSSSPTSPVFADRWPVCPYRRF